MFDFRPSAELTKKIIDTIDSELTIAGVSLPSLLGRHIEKVRSACGISFVRVIGVFAHRVRHGLYEGPEGELVILSDGVFPEKINEHLANALSIPPGNAGKMLTKALAKEFFEWAKEHGRATVFSPHAPIERFSIAGDNVSVLIRPYEPAPKDPDFVPATVVFE